MASSFTISTLAGRALAELPLDGAAPNLVVGDLLERLPLLDGAGVPRLLLGPRELGWSERLADLALAPGCVVTLVLVLDPEKAAADLMGTDGTPVRLAAARALRAMGAAAAGYAAAALSAVLSDPTAGVADEALQALRAMQQERPPAERGDAVALLERHRASLLVPPLARLAKGAQDIESLGVEGLGVRLMYREEKALARRLKTILALCDASPGQAALRRQRVLRKLDLLNKWHAVHPCNTAPRPEPQGEAEEHLGAQRVVCAQVEKGFVADGEQRHAGRRRLRGPWPTSRSGRRARHAAPSTEAGELWTTSVLPPQEDGGGPATPGAALLSVA